MENVRACQGQTSAERTRRGASEARSPQIQRLQVGTPTNAHTHFHFDHTTLFLMLKLSLKRHKAVCARGQANTQHGEQARPVVLSRARDRTNRGGKRSPAALLERRVDRERGNSERQQQQQQQQDQCEVAQCRATLPTTRAVVYWRSLAIFQLGALRHIHATSWLPIAITFSSRLFVCLFVCCID